VGCREEREAPRMRIYHLDLRHEGVFFRGRPVGRPFEKAGQLIEAIRGLKGQMAHTRSFRLLSVSTPYFDLKVDKLGILYLSKGGTLLLREYSDRPASLFKRELKNWLHCTSDVLSVLNEGRDKP